jgi:hypothetical protein
MYILESNQSWSKWCWCLRCCSLVVLIDARLMFRMVRLESGCQDEGDPCRTNPCCRPTPTARLARFQVPTVARLGQIKSHSPHHHGKRKLISALLIIVSYTCSETLLMQGSRCRGYAIFPSLLHSLYAASVHNCPLGNAFVNPQSPPASVISVGGSGDCAAQPRGGTVEHGAESYAVCNILCTVCSVAYLRYTDSMS